MGGREGRNRPKRVERWMQARGMASGEIFFGGRERESGWKE